MINISLSEETTTQPSDSAAPASKGVIICCQGYVLPLPYRTVKINNRSLTTEAGNGAAVSLAPSQHSLLFYPLLSYSPLT
jgi:hypothetical protein